MQMGKTNWALVFTYFSVEAETDFDSVLLIKENALTLINFVPQCVTI
jgi:hypothetical protein